MQTATQEVDVRPAAYYYSPNELISDTNQALLLSFRDVITLTYFGIGDIANQEIVNNAHRKGITDQMVYDAVGVFCGKSGRTVRYYAENAAFYSNDMRGEYDMLSFAHFDAARNYQYWRDVLEIAKTNPGMTLEELVRYADRLREIFEVRPPASENSDVRPPACEDSQISESSLPDYERIADEIKSGLPGARPWSAAQLVGKILNSLAHLRRLLRDYTISDELREEVIDHVEALDRLIPLLIRDIETRSDK